MSFLSGRHDASDKEIRDSVAEIIFVFVFVRFTAVQITPNKKIYH
jgi:hypothetical protein